MRRLTALASLAVVSTLVACGGGGYSAPPSPPPPPPPSSNVAAITVDAGPTGSNIASVNTPFVSVTICAPGSTSNCQTIDHIEVDTASSGLRILSSVVNTTLGLPQEMDATNTPIVECALFADGFSWGPVKTADVQVSDEAAASVPVQIIGDPAFPAVPTQCSSAGGNNPEDTVATFGANGILGVGPFIDDAGDYFTCAGASCTGATIATALEVSNPVAFFPVDNNGVVVQLPAVATTGSPPLTGSLIFGIGTESNNGLGTAVVYTLDPSFGSLTITYKSQVYDNSYLDTGSNANFLVDATIPVCTDNGFFCPTATLPPLSATISGVNNVNVTEQFSVANADALFNNVSAVAFGNLAAPNPDSTSFDFGLPFFFNRTVFTAIANANTPGGIGPYVAF
jgi:Protein of unknown function (DUF3443)